MARSYNRVPDGVVNDRFYQVDPGLLRRLVRLPGVRTLMDGMASKAFLGGIPPASNLHCDFTTPEYSSHVSRSAKKWETCRGLGYSFGCSWASSARTATCF
jgi:alpha-L-fucosidase